MGATNPTQIKTYIHNAYNTWDIPPVAVLLMGDYSTDLSIGIPADVFPHPYPFSDTYITDNLYADVSGNELPDIIFGRMAAEEVEDMAVLVSKFIEYETQPCMNQNYYKNPITALGWQTERWFQICSEAVGGYWRNQGKTPVRINEIYYPPQDITVWSNNSNVSNTNAVVDYFGPNGTGYIPASPTALGGWSGGTAQQIITAINNGAFALQHRDHGSVNGWGEPDFTLSHISQLTNTGKMTYVFTINCQTGKFDHNTPCFGEVFHRHTYQGQNAGCVGFLGPTEVSYSFVNDAFAWGMYDLFDPEFLPTYGASYGINTGSYVGYSGNWMPAFGNVSGKYFLHFSSWPYNTSDKEITYRMFTAHSDVFLRLFTEVPQPINVSHALETSFGDTNFQITATAGTLIALTTNGEILDVAIATGSLQTLSIPSTLPIGTSIYVVCTGQNYLRYEAVVSVGCYTGLPIVQGTISQNTTWNEDVQAIDNITILDGATLTIKSTVKCNLDVSIIVQPGGKLVVNGGTLTNACFGKMWPGILVLGQRDKPQLPEYQGSVELNNATIENAILAVSAAYTGYYNQNGGIIKATNSTFRNNLRAIEYCSYENHNASGAVIDNVGRFERCTFKIDNNNLFAANGRAFQHHVTMWEVNGVKFTGCTFDNLLSSQSGKGIYSVDAGYKIYPYCTAIIAVPGGIDCPCAESGKTPALFKNFDWGVHSYNTGNPYQVYIDQSEFRNNKNAISFLSSDNFRVTRSDFYGIVNQGLGSYGSSGYHIEGNSFNGVSTTSTIGISMGQSGSADNMIYKNYFSKLQRGIVAKFTNSIVPGSGGITYKGIDPGGDVQLVPRGLQFQCNNFHNVKKSIYLDDGSSVCRIQGNLLKGADNTFTGSQDNSIYMLTSQAIIYYHHAGGNRAPYLPIINSSSSIVGTAGENPCALTFCVQGGIVAKNSGEPDIEKYKAMQDEYDKLATEFEKNEYGYVLTYPDKFPKEVVTAAEECLAKLQELSEAMRSMSMTAVHAILQDSILYTKQLKEWYEVIRTPIAKYLLAEAHAFTKDYEKAESVLKNMSELFKFGETEKKEHDNYLKFFNFKKKMTLSGRNWANLNEDEVKELENIAQATCGRSATMAQGVLCFFFDICKEYEDCRSKEEMNPKIAEAETEFSPENLKEEISIHPNPTTGELTVETHGRASENVALFDIFGRKVFETNENTFNINHLPEGVYIIKIHLENGEIVTRKVVKQ